LRRHDCGLREGVTELCSRQLRRNLSIVFSLEHAQYKCKFICVGDVQWLRAAVSSVLCPRLRATPCTSAVCAADTDIAWRPLCSPSVSFIAVRAVALIALTRPRRHSRPSSNRREINDARNTTARRARECAAQDLAWRDVADCWSVIWSQQDVN